MERHIFDEDHEAFRATCAAFIADKISPHADEYRAAKGFPRDMWKALGAQGLLGLEIPESLGGMEAGDYRFNAVFTEELGKHSAALAGCVSIHTDVVIPYIVKLGTAEQQRRWLPAAASGDVVTAIGMTEPSGGSDLAGLQTTAVRDGDTWVINGSKTFITNGASADLLIAAVRTSPGAGAKGITLFVLQSDDPGYQRGRTLDKVGQDEADTAEIFFDDLRVTDDRVLGTVDRGFFAMMDMLPHERLTCAVVNVAHASQILSETIEYARERHAFGSAIGSLQHNKFLLAELVTKIEVTQAYIDAAIMAQVRGDLTAIDAAKAKWWSADIQNEVLDHCLQLHGGYGYMNEYRVARAWRDARVTRIWAGSNEIMKELIGRDLGF